MKIINFLKKIKNRYGLINFILTTFLRPKFQYERILILPLKLIVFVRHSLFLKVIEKSLKEKNYRSKENLFLIAGKQIEISWIQIWITISLLLSDKIDLKYVLTSRKSFFQNICFYVFGFKLIFIEDSTDKIFYPKDFLNNLNNLQSIDDIKDFAFEDIPFGRMALSTYCRTRRTGLIEENNVFFKEIENLTKETYANYFLSKKIYKKYKIKHLFFSELFMGEYGSFYYGAINQKLNIIRFNGTVRDNAVIISRMKKESNRKHSASFSKESWIKILNNNENEKYKEQLNQNFKDRYGEKWYLSKRNQPNTKFFTKEEIMNKFSIPKGKKIAIIYSHILFDLLYYHGEDIFQNYADWFTQTLKEIKKNKNLIWFIKIHPSNVWRGEINKFYGNKTEEENLIIKTIGKLPNHIKLIYPDSEISPFSWMQFTDYGITVRGTPGIELASLGKQVITAGTGRYEKIGFTINPKSIDEYKKILSKIHELPPLGQEKHRLAMRFAYATFYMKPFILDFMKVSKLIFKRNVRVSDDLLYLPIKKLFENNIMPSSILRFKEWMFNSTESDFLNEFPE